MRQAHLTVSSAIGGHVGMGRGKCWLGFSSFLITVFGDLPRQTCFNQVGI